MKQVIKCIAAVAVLAMTTAVSAQSAEYTVPAVKTLAQAGGVGTTMDIVSNVPQKVTLVWHNAGANFLNVPPPEIVTTPAPDDTGKGTANNAFFASAPAFFNGKLFCVAVTGPTLWSGIDENKRFDLGKMPCVVINGTDVRISLAFKEPGTYAVSPVIVEPSGKFVAWAFNAEGATKRILDRPDKTKDMATVLHASASAPVAAANDAQFAEFQGLYACFFTTEGKCAAKVAATK